MHGIDHLVLVGHDLVAMIAAYRGFGFTVTFVFACAPPPAGGGGAGGGGGAADMNVTFSNGGDSSSTCQNEYTTPAAISAPWNAIDNA